MPPLRFRGAGRETVRVDGCQSLLACPVVSASGCSANQPHPPLSSGWLLISDYRFPARGMRPICGCSDSNPGTQCRQAISEAIQSKPSQVAESGAIALRQRCRRNRPFAGSTGAARESLPSTDGRHYAAPAHLPATVSFGQFSPAMTGSAPSARPGVGPARRGPASARPGPARPGAARRGPTWPGLAGRRLGRPPARSGGPER
jgi:hypothetical protein